MTYEDRMQRLQALMEGNKEAYMARKLDSLPGSKKQRRLESPPPKKKSLIPDFFSLEREMKMAYEDMQREMSRLMMFEAPPETYTCRYPVKKSLPTFEWNSYESLSSSSSSFTEHEVRFTEGGNSVEVWEGEKLICRIPIHALQTVLMDELHA